MASFYSRLGGMAMLHSSDDSPKQRQTPRQGSVIQKQRSGGRAWGSGVCRNEASKGQGNGLGHCCKDVDKSIGSDSSWQDSGKTPAAARRQNFDLFPPIQRHRGGVAEFGNDLSSKADLHDNKSSRGPALLTWVRVQLTSDQQLASSTSSKWQQRWNSS